nr:PQQ-binding-like beta-propeller repeat protein [Micromonospora sp. DSM 115978]
MLAGPAPPAGAPPVDVTLGVDFGTSHTVAVLGWPDGRIRPLVFDGSRLMPSAVFADPGGVMLAGRDARHAARTHPDRFEPHPKRRIDDGLVRLGDTEVSVVDLVAAVLAPVAAEATRVAGGRPRVTVLTHPATWRQARTGTLLAAAERAGLPAVTLLPEPVAAAQHFLHGRAAVPDGATILVYDLGAGTFDASVVRRTGAGVSVVATRGLDDTGGRDIDAAVVAYLGSVYAARQPAAWRALMAPVTAGDGRASQRLWEDVRVAKESLSRLPATVVPLPTIGTDAPLGRAQLEELAGSIVARTVAASLAVLHDAAVAPDHLAGVFLVGGGSRLPLAGTALHRALGIAPTVLEQPETVVAEGSVLLAPDHSAGGIHTTAPAGTATEVEAGAATAVGAGRRGRWSRRRVLSAGAVTVAAGALPTVLSGDQPTRRPLRQVAGSATSEPGGPTSAPAPTPAPTPAPAPGELLWRAVLPGIRHQPTVGGGRVFVLCNDGVCYAVRASDGSTDWSRRVAPGMFRNPVGAPTLVGDRLYVGSHDNRLYLLDATTGAVLKRATSENVLTSAPAVDDRLVYLAQAALETYDPATLTPRWRFERWTAGSGPLLTGDVVVFSTNSPEVYAVGRADGRQRWRYRPTGIDFLSKQLAATAGAVFVTGSDGSCFAIERRTGALRWRRRGIGSEFAAPAAAGDLVFTAAAGNVCASRAGDGKLVWRTRVDGFIVSPLTVAEGLVYASTTTVVTALRVATGAVAWSHPLGPTSGVRVADSVAYAGGETGWLTALAAPPTA